MLTILLTAITTSLFTAGALFFLFTHYVQPYIEAQIIYIKQQADLKATELSPQLGEDIANAIEDKFNELRPEVEEDMRQDLINLINECLPAISQEVEQGVDNSFKKFIPTIVGSAATMPAETIIRTSSTILNTGLGILKSVTSEPKK